ncbi:MAG: alanine--tRNA ligase [Chloroflexi bacterium]|nr:alanine--tRNA ligase [Chloroflexota bacterium]
MNSDALRSLYLRFFEGRGHLALPSASLVPQGDPTLLLTSAGMVPFKPYFTGAATPPRPRITTCQKCFRTTDIDSVGNSKHLTFFEMLGNFSFGDYFKPEAIAWAWEFVTKELNLPPERLWATVFTDDDEAFALWQGQGVPAERIRRYEEKDNFWGPAGDSGPCGPCSELHYDFGPNKDCPRPASECGPDCPCGRFLEIWNLVFVQYNQDPSGTRQLLSRPSVDTGMGLERTATLLQGKRSFYDTDLFAPFMAHIAQQAGVKYGADEKTDRALRVVAEHGRAVAFLVADGVIPANEGRGYVLRRVLRRAARYGRTLGLEGPFLADVAERVIAQMKHIYPELEQNRDFVLRVVSQEQERFQETLNQGMSLLDGFINAVKAKRRGEIPGGQVFQLYDTYGFPKEVTAEVAAEHGLAVDWEGFERELAAQRERARAAHRFALGAKPDAAAYALWADRPTVFVGYEKTRHTAQVIGLLVGGQSVPEATAGQEVEIILAETPFYGELGGQVGDAGTIVGQNGAVEVADSQRPLADLVVHRGKVAEGRVAVGEAVEARVDEERRLDIARNHTATHLLQAALREALGPQVRQAGSLVAPDRLRFDFSHLVALSPEELARVQARVNQRIRQDLPVTSRLMPYKEALETGALAFFEEAYGDTVRVMEIKEGSARVSAELCGGTHLSRTGEIGFCLITAETGIGAGMRRLEALTGRGAEAFVAERLGLLGQAAKALKAQAAEVPERLVALQAELAQERKKAQAQEREAGREQAEDLLARTVTVGDIPLLAAEVSASSLDSLRQVGDVLRKRMGSGVIVLGAVWDGRPNFVVMVTPDLVAKGLHAGKIVGQVAAVTGGGGGGKPELGQAGGKDKDKLAAALSQAARIVGQARG